MKLKKEEQRFLGKPGTWRRIDAGHILSRWWYMYESETCGNERPHLVVDKRGRLLCDTYDTLLLAVTRAMEERRKIREAV